MPQVASAVLSGGRAAGISHGSGYRLDRDGVHFARGVLGDLASTNFVGGPDGRGWRLRGDGSGELQDITVNLASVRGTLTAGHVSADVRNWVLLRDAQAVININRTGIGPTFTIVGNVSAYDSVFFIGSLRGVALSTFVPTSAIRGLSSIFGWQGGVAQLLNRTRTLSVTLRVRIIGTTLETYGIASGATGTAIIDGVWGISLPKAT